MKVGDRVYHRRLGLGVIEQIHQKDAGDDYAAVKFDAGRTQLISLAGDYLTLSTEPVPNPAEDRWPDDTFSVEDETVEHCYSMRWVPFTDDAIAFINQWCQSDPEWLHKEGWALLVNKQPPQRHYWSNLFKGSYLITPHRMHGLCMRVERVNDEIKACDWLVFVQHGTQCNLTIDSVSVWPNQDEAIIRANWHEIEICFYDTAYLHNRDWYRTQSNLSFLLTGFALSARVDEPQTMNIEHKADVLEAINRHMSESGQPLWEESMQVSTQGMAAWLPNETDANVYQFRGTVCSVKRISELLHGQKLLDQDGWLLEVMCLRPMDSDELPLSIVVTEKIWGQEPEPQVGQDILGTLYLQGELAYA